MGVLKVPLQAVVVDIEDGTVGLEMLDEDVKLRRKTRSEATADEESHHQRIADMKNL